MNPAVENECARIAAKYTGREPPPETADAIVARNADLFSLAAQRPVPRPPHRPRSESFEDELARSAPVRSVAPGEDGTL